MLKLQGVQPLRGCGSYRKSEFNTDFSRSEGLVRTKSLSIEVS